MAELVDAGDLKSPEGNPFVPVRVRLRAPTINRLGYNLTASNHGDGAPCKQYVSRLRSGRCCKKGNAHLF